MAVGKVRGRNKVTLYPCFTKISLRIAKEKEREEKKLKKKLRGLNLNVITIVI